MQHLTMPGIRRGAPQTPALAGRALTFAETRGLRTTARSLPEWLAWRARWSGGSVETSGRLTSTRPAAVPDMTAAERAAAESKAAELECIVAPEAWPVVIDHDDHDRPIVIDAEQAKLVLVTRMLMAKASANVTAEGAAARGESYMIALEGLPAWAVEAAIAEWYRGEVPGVDKADFKWSPDSSVLRRVAAANVAPYRSLLDAVRRALAARPLSEVLAAP